MRAVHSISINRNKEKGAEAAPEYINERGYNNGNS